ncbi:MAG: glycoside hydrolase family 3 N-terminal domain-containing protein, partial [Pseudomonadota bacterium]
GARLSDDERALFRDVNPWGFILFGRHCESAENIRAHCDELRACVGRDAPILIDQEGGRVARLKPPTFPGHAPPAAFGELWRLDPAKAQAAVRLNAALIARMLSSLGVNVNCAPSLDVPQIDADPATVGDRALAKHPETIAALARAALEGFVAGGVAPVIKHMPGLGRALTDSHKELPRVIARREDLEREDFAPFKALNDAKIGMTCHVLFDALDPDRPATLSPTIVRDVIRGEIGFDGLLLTDDLKMEALTGTYGARAKASLAAGCDVALMCNMTLDDKIAAAGDIPALSAAAAARARAAMAEITPADQAAAADQYAELSQLLKPVLA